MSAAFGFGLIICLFVLVIVAMVIGFLIRNIYYKEVDELETKKNTLSDRGVAEELAKIKALNMTGEAEVHFEAWREQWDEIVASKLPEITFDLMEVDELLGKYSFGKAKKLLKKTKQEIEGIEQQIQDIFLGVNHLMESYERNKEEITNIHKAYKKLKKALLAHRHSFTLIEKEIEHELNQVQENILKYEELTRNGDYFEASEVVDQILHLIAHLEVVMDEAPQLQVECQTGLPAQIEDIAEGYSEMCESGYILTHLNIDEEIKELQQINNEVLTLVRELKVDDVKNKLEESKVKIDTIYDSLESEVASKQEVIGNVEYIDTKITDVRSENKSSKEETATVKLSYQLSDKEIESQKYIEKQLMVLTKRYNKIHEQVSQNELAYSIALIDLRDIRSQLDKLEFMQREYTETLQMLRADELKAKEEIVKMRHILQETKRILTVSNLPGVPESYYSRFNEAKEKMDLVQNQLDVKPLDMSLVNELLKDSILIVEDVYREAIDMVERVYLVEQVIQYGNRYRRSNHRIASSLHKAEKLFREFEYEAALEEAAAALDSIDQGAIERIQQLVNEKKTPLY